LAPIVLSIRGRYYDRREPDVGTRRGTKKVVNRFIWVVIDPDDLEQKIQDCCRNLAMPPAKGVIDPK